MTVLADVGEEAIAIICKPHHRGDLADPADELSDLPVRRLFGEVDPANIAALGDHEHMEWRLRVYIVKGVDPVVLIDFLRRNLAAQDFGEDVVVVLGQVAVDGHVVSLPFCAMPFPQPSAERRVRETLCQYVSIPLVAES